MTFDTRNYTDPRPQKRKRRVNWGTVFLVGYFIAAAIFFSASVTAVLVRDAETRAVCDELGGVVVNAEVCIDPDAVLKEW